MDISIKKLPKNRKNPTDNEREIIRRALISYQIVMDQYEKYTDEMKQKDLERLQKENSKTNLDTMNPFNVNMDDTPSFEPTLEETKEFVYSSWAEAVANAQTPYPCDSSKRKGIRKKTFRDIQNGKFLTKRVLDKMDEYIKRLS